MIGSNSGDGWLYAGSLFTDPANWGDWAENWQQRIASAMIGRSEPSLQVRWSDRVGYNFQRTQPWRIVFVLLTLARELLDLNWTSR